MGPTAAPPKIGFLVGGDVSEIPEVEARGGTYSYKGKRQDPFKILKSAGWNFIRLRVWNEPKEGFSNKAHTLAMAKRVKAAGMTLSIDFHYSDWWADPGKQNKPAAWRNYNLDQLANAVRTYTKDVVGALVKQGTPPHMVQVGNEIIGGMLWPEGKLRGNDERKWKDLTKLVNAGVEGVRQAQGKRKILTMVHLDRGGSNADSRWWLDNAIKHGMQFDTIGQSFYPWWHGTLGDLESNLTDLASRYKKDVYLTEVAYPWSRDPARGPGFAYDTDLKTKYPATPEGQADFLREVVDIVKRSNGKGVLYWAPTWISTKKEHIPWSNMAIFNDAGEALPAVDVLGASVRKR
jgi:arabinogalactan endo-1,4-beta-galactosidase